MPPDSLAWNPTAESECAVLQVGAAESLGFFDADHDEPHPPRETPEPEPQTGSLVELLGLSRSLSLGSTVVAPSFFLNNKKKFMSLRLANFFSFLLFVLFFFFFFVVGATERRD